MIEKFFYYLYLLSILAFERVLLFIFLPFENKRGAPFAGKTWRVTICTKSETVKKTTMKRDSGGKIPVIMKKVFFIFFLFYGMVFVIYCGLKYARFGRYCCFVSKCR